MEIHLYVSTSHRKVPSPRNGVKLLHQAQVRTTSTDHVLFRDVLFLVESYTEWNIRAMRSDTRYDQGWRFKREAPLGARSGREIVHILQLGLNMAPASKIAKPATAQWYSSILAKRTTGRTKRGLQVPINVVSPDLCGVCLLPQMLCPCVVPLLSSCRYC